MTERFLEWKKMTCVLSRVNRNKCTSKCCRTLRKKGKIFKDIREKRQITIKSGKK